MPNFATRVNRYNRNAGAHEPMCDVIQIYRGRLKARNPVVPYLPVL